MAKPSGVLIVVCGSLVLTACGGGGGGAGLSATLSPFTSWGDVRPSTTVQVNGISQSGTYTYDVNANKVLTASIGASATGASYTATYDSNGNPTSVTLTPAGGSAITWSRSAGDIFGYLIIAPSIDAVVSADGTKFALAANPIAYGWNYQSFGIWQTGGGTGSGTYGAMSVGAATPGASIPTSGSATYTGFTGGRYIDSSGTPYFTSSSMSAATNFGTRNITFTTSNTYISPSLSSSGTLTNNLNMTGTLTYSVGTNSITGSVATTGGTILSGSAAGQFYGPSATEIGGTFAVKASSGTESYAGGFGGKR